MLLFVLFQLVSCKSEIPFDCKIIGDTDLTDSLSSFEFLDTYPRKEPGSTYEYQITPLTISLIDGNNWVKNNNSYSIGKLNCYNTYEIELNEFDSNYYFLYVPKKTKEKLDEFMHDDFIYKNSFDSSYDGVGLKSYAYIDGRYLRAAQDASLLNECKWYKTTNLDAIEKIANNVGVILKMQEGVINKNISLGKAYYQNAKFLTRVIKSTKNFESTISKDCYLKSLIEIESDLSIKTGKHLITGNVDVNLKTYYSNPIFLGASLKPLFIKADLNFTIDNTSKSLFKDNYPDIFSKYFENEEQINIGDLEECIYETYQYSITSDK